MVRPDGSAYGIPISVVREDDHFYFHSAMEGEKLESILYQTKPVSAQSADADQYLTNLL